MKFSPPDWKTARNKVSDRKVLWHNLSKWIKWLLTLILTHKINGCYGFLIFFLFPVLYFVRIWASLVCHTKESRGQPFVSLHSNNVLETILVCIIWSSMYRVMHSQNNEKEPTGFKEYVIQSAFQICRVLWHHKPRSEQNYPLFPTSHHTTFSKP